MDINNFMPWIWGAIFIITTIIELKTFDIDPLCFVIASLIVLITRLIFPDLNIVWQLVIFVGTSLVLLLTLAKFVKYHLRTKNIANNANNLVGKDIVIIEDCNEFDKGSGMLDNVVWVTKAQTGSSLHKGDTATIVALDNNKLIVKNKEMN